MDHLEKIETDCKEGLIGFLIELQDYVASIGWGYVHNPSGGFYGFWGDLDNCTFNERDNPHIHAYFQVCFNDENTIFQIRIDAQETSNSSQRSELRNEANRWFTNKYNELKKPSRFGNGKTMTVAEKHFKPWKESRVEIRDFFVKMPVKTKY